MKDVLLLAIKGLAHRKLRSYLTVIGVVIGVASVVSLVSITQGMNEAVRQMFEQFGADKIIIMPGSMELGLYSALTGAPLTDDDLKAVKSVPEVDIAFGMASDNLVIEFRREKKVLPVYGVPTKDFKRIFEEVQGYDLEAGSYFSPSDKYKVIVGYYLAHNMFDTEVRPGATMYINGVKFKVIGVIEQIGSKIDDSSIIIPMQAFEELTGREGEYMTIMAKVKDGADITAVAEKIKKKLERTRGAEDFSVLTSEQMAQRVSTILGLMGLVFIGVAAVSLVVGAVGIMNTMYMSVVERTREIGVMKAVGATPKQILSLFLAEAAIIGSIGGIIGVVLGGAVSLLIENAAKQTGYTIFRALLSPELVVGSIVFATLVGMVAGYLPARHAASLDPVVALRYE